jgi:hypothetical protein
MHGGKPDEDVQRSLMVLSPHGTGRHRLIVIGRKRLPEPDDPGRQRYWCFVEGVTSRPESIEEALRSHTYWTKSAEHDSCRRRDPPASQLIGMGTGIVLMLAMAVLD